MVGGCYEQLFTTPNMKIGLEPVHPKNAQMLTSQNGRKYCFLNGKKSQALCKTNSVLKIVK